jgi:hypothetical protein
MSSQFSVLGARLSIKSYRFIITQSGAGNICHAGRAISIYDLPVRLKILLYGVWRLYKKIIS